MAEFRMRMLFFPLPYHISSLLLGIISGSGKSGKDVQIVLAGDSAGGSFCLRSP